MQNKIVFENVAYLFFSDVLTRIITAIVAIALARYLGATEYGMISVALAFSVVAGYFADLGLAHTLIREGTKKNADLNVLMSSYIKARFLFGAITALFSIGIIEWFYEDAEFKMILSFMVLPIILGATLQGIGAVYFQVTQKMKYTALIRGMSALIASISLIIGMHLNLEVHIISVIYGLSSIIGGIISCGLVFKRITFTRKWDKKIFNQLLVFSIGGFGVMTIPQLGPLVLEKVTTVTEVGFFSAAYRIPAVLYQVPGIIATAFYPLLFKYANSNKMDEHLNLSILELKIMSFIGAVVSLPFLIYAEWWIVIMFGEEWVRSSYILQILSVIVIIQSINYPLADSLTTKGYQKIRTNLVLIAMFIGIALYINLGELYGAVGGAISAISIELFLMVGYLIFNRTGGKILFKGASLTLVSLGITVSVSKSLELSIHPFLGSILIVFIFCLILFTIDKQLSKYVLEKVLLIKNIISYKWRQS
ncbi:MULTISPECIES: oligosaccharide flippase family protein [unclassified Exiguobacterium]|uniref:oligosaccharide flippase family protein n=1 Tax=unclassified Exiguobacterium TaxID=2644629 RepID=UPI00103E7D53|nr:MULTISPECIES: oligosaccharide flippase family protein [unclassified Exiguobacterium]TCI48272.1 flippase [Exiguobacterium sp. SH5S32]TCI55158.1 flippase [Exiguobacterium sp. SH1S4]TCI74952.1 flippase [Exiguobacterium sp. SH1S1]